MSVADGFASNLSFDPHTTVYIFFALHVRTFAKTHMRDKKKLVPPSPPPGFWARFVVIRGHFV